MLCSANPLLQTAFADPYMSHEASGQVEALKRALESYNEDPPFLLARKPARPAAWSTPDVLFYEKLCMIVQFMAREEARSSYASQVNASMTRGADEAPSDAFQFGYKSAIAGLENTFYFFVESVLTEIAQN